MYSLRVLGAAAGTTFTICFMIAFYTAYFISPIPDMGACIAFNRFGEGHLEFIGFTAAAVLNVLATLSYFVPGVFRRG